MSAPMRTRDLTPAPPHDTAPLDVNAPRITARPGDDVTNPSANTPADSLDISASIDGWGVGPDELSARLIRGIDGRPLLQMRVEMGVIQMEVDGRPDATPEEGAVIQLDRLRGQLITHRRRHRSGFGFEISSHDAALLEYEGRLFARRYLAWFILSEWQRVIDDAAHHLEILRFLRDHTAPGDEARQAIVRWLPYAAMMQARAQSAIAVERRDVRGALKLVQSAQRLLKRHYRKHGGESAYDTSAEVKSLKTVVRQLRRRLPESPMRRLRRQLRIAIELERYEQAALLRDRISRLTGNSSTSEV